MPNEALERMIDRAGRQDVFDMVRSAGWRTGAHVPVWVWQEACQEVMKQKDDKEQS